jgi:alkylation response protein AidB-like acyl-CoA dehydrogenase
MFAEAIEALLRDHCTPAAVRAIEAGGSPAALWQAFEEGGYLQLLAPEAQGGAGLPLPQCFAIVELLGRYAVPVPLAQAIAARALVPDGAELPAGLLTLAPALRREGGALHCPLVPFGAHADHLLAADGDELVLLRCADAARTPTGVHGSLTASLTWRDAAALQRIGGAADALQPWAAALHAALLAGAMAAAFEITLQYCNQRVQFGKTLGKFQAVQHQLSVMAEHVAAATMAAEAAFQTEARAPALLPAAMAKARASEAAVAVANTAHALHGAIGITAEYDLQLLTRRLHEWRMLHGSEDHWHAVVGRQVLAHRGGLLEFVRAA